MKDVFGREWEMVTLKDKKNTLIKLVKKLGRFMNDWKKTK
jgi:hypothetical protein